MLLKNLIVQQLYFFVLASKRAVNSVDELRTYLVGPRSLSIESVG